MNTEKTIILDLSALLMLEENQIREKTEWTTVRRYAGLMAGGTTFPPVKVALTDPTDETKGYTLVDGWHRVMATKVNDGETIVAEVVAAKPEEVAWLSVEANRGHGLQLKLTRVTRRKIFRAYVRAGKHRTGRGRKLKTYSLMAKDLIGIVSRRQLPAWMAADFPAIYKAMNGNGLEEQDHGGVKTRDMNEGYANEAKDSLDNFMACMRALNDNRRALAILRKAVACIDEVSEAVTGKKEWPSAAATTSAITGDF